MTIIETRPVWFLAISSFVCHFANVFLIWVALDVGTNLNLKSIQVPERSVTGT